MVVHRRKKVTRYRGHTNDGGGSRKKRRGAGSRGGRGRAGTGKRAGQKKAGMPPQLGSFGFLPRRWTPEVRTINVGDFTVQRVDQFLATGKAVKDGQMIIIHLTQLGYGKLLGAGSTIFKLKITVASSSPGAVEKIAAAGGQVLTQSRVARGESNK